MERKRREPDNVQDVVESECPLENGSDIPYYQRLLTPTEQSIGAFFGICDDPFEGEYYDE